MMRPGRPRSCWWSARCPPRASSRPSTRCCWCAGDPRRSCATTAPEFVSLALDQWASAHGIRLDFIRPGHPVENCFIESFNGKLRDECLNQHHFVSLAEAQQRIETWRQEYHTERPHRGLGQRTPAEYAASFTPEEGHSSDASLRC